jgi:cell division protein FtsA
MNYEKKNYKFDPQTTVAAIDIGTTKIVAIVGRKEENGKIKIFGIGQAPSIGVKRGVVLNIEETSKAIRKAVDEAERQSGYSFKNVVVGIAGQHIKSIKNRGFVHIEDEDQEIKQKHIDALFDQMYRIPLANAGEEILHVIPQSYTVDNEAGIRTNIIGMYGRRLEGTFHIVVGQTSSAKNIIKCIERAGLVLDTMVLEPLASADAVLTDDDKEAGVAMIDIGGGTTDIAIFHDNVIRHTAVIPFGGAVITHDIKEGLQIVERNAEKIKLQFGHALGAEAPQNEVISIEGLHGQPSKRISTHQLAMIIQARMEEIIEAINFELISSGYSSKLGSGIVLTGGGALLKSLPQLFNFHTGKIVRVARPSDMVIVYNDGLTHPKYSTSIGLVIQGFEYYEKNERKIVEEEVEEIEEDTKNSAKDSQPKLAKKARSILSIFEGFFNDTDTSM